MLKCSSERCVWAPQGASFAVERERLQHDVEAAVVLVREHEADVEPVVVLAFSPNHGIGAVRRLARFFVRHDLRPAHAVLGAKVSRELARGCIQDQVDGGTFRK
jgi:hypothetical protein